MTRTDSIGTCSICGYHGPGPRHDCKPGARSAVHLHGDGWSPEMQRVVDEIKAQRPARVTIKPTHYKLVCISLYTRDLERALADEMVKELKRRGITKMSRSELIRIALARLVVDTIAAKEVA